MKAKKGISLIVLVITILVIIVLAGAVILTVAKDNPLEKASEANVLSDRTNIQYAIQLYISANMSNTATDTVAIMKNLLLDKTTVDTKVANPINFTATGLDMVAPKTPHAEQKWVLNINTGKVAIKYVAIANVPEWAKNPEKTDVADAYKDLFIK